MKKKELYIRGIDPYKECTVLECKNWSMIIENNNGVIEQFEGEDFQTLQEKNTHNT